MKSRSLVIRPAMAVKYRHWTGGPRSLCTAGRRPNEPTAAAKPATPAFHIMGNPAALKSQRRGLFR